jgi:hypothetical protein
VSHAQPAGSQFSLKMSGNFGFGKGHMGSVKWQDYYS